VGYTGYAAREFMLPQYCYPIAQGDVLGFAQTLEAVLAEFGRDPRRLQQQAADYAEFLRTHYSKDVEGKSVVEAWTRLCGAGQRRETKNVTTAHV
jgi:hypothetical protein